MVTYLLSRNFTPTNSRKLSPRLSTLNTTGPRLQIASKLYAKNVTTELNAVRAMVLLALVLDVGAIVCGALKLFVMKDKKVLGNAASGLLATADLFLIVGFAVYVAKIFDPLKSEYTLHVAFAFCIIAWLASWTAAGSFGVATVQDKD